MEPPPRILEPVSHHEPATPSLYPPNLLASAITVLALAAVLIFTRLLSNHPESPPDRDGVHTPATHGHWLPLLAHAPRLTPSPSPSSLLSRLRPSHPSGIFSLFSLGTRHYVVSDPSLEHALLRMPHTVFDTTRTARDFRTSIFGLSPDADRVFSLLFPHNRHAHRSPLLWASDPDLAVFLDPLLAAAARQLGTHAAELVSFNAWPVDQTPWERAAHARLVETTTTRETFVEADLLRLVRHFVARTAGAALFGTDFVDNFPDAWALLWRLERDVDMLASGLPCWLPLPRLQRARATRRKLLGRLRVFEMALEMDLEGGNAGSTWHGLDTTSSLVRGRCRHMHEEGLDAEARAACTLMLLWETGCGAPTVVAWLLCELYRHGEVLARVREEVSPFVTAVRPRNGFGPAVWLAPRVDGVDVDGLAEKCPVLTAAYLETLRVYTATAITGWLARDVLIEGKGEKRFRLVGGSCVHLVRELRLKDPARWADPEEWRPRRHLREAAGEKGREEVVTDEAELTGIDSKAGEDGKQFTLRQVLLYTAIIVTLYEVQPPAGRKWDRPQMQKSGAMRHPGGALPVWISRRDVPEGR